YFKIFLPGTTAANDIPGIGEQGLAGVGGTVAGVFPDANNCEIIWCCYAWPVSPEQTGNRAFFINQEGDLTQTLNNQTGTNTVAGTFYSGLNAVPAATAAYSDAGANGGLTGMGSPMAIAAQGLVANDGNVWTKVGQ